MIRNGGYNDTLKAINTLENNFKSTRQHPFIPEKLLKRLTEIFDDVSKELEKIRRLFLRD